MNGKYFILDFGEEMEQYTLALVKELRKDGHHVVYYLTDSPYVMCLEEVNEDTFLDHYKNYLKTNN